MNLESATEFALSGLSMSLRNRFAADPKAVITEGLGLKLRAVDHLAHRRDDGGVCDGLSFLDDGVILYAATDFSRRENFTLAHELAHWLVERNDDLYNWLADQGEPERMLETLCDRVAQNLLLPEAFIDSIVGTGPIRAEHLLDLFKRSEASRPVCAIALAKRLSCCGAVLLASHESARVTYASIKPEVDRGWPTVFPWPGQDIPAGHPLSGMRPGTSWTRHSYWMSPWGARRNYYADALRVGERIIAVLADIDLWGAERFHPVQHPEFDERPSAEITCCGRSIMVRGYPCEECGQLFCPTCKRCECDRRAEREGMCGKCFLRFQRHLLINELCESCRE